MHDIYSQKVRYCILFASRDYREKVWTNHEREAAQERALQEKGGEYILPVRIDDTTIPGLPSTTGYIPIQLGIEEICRRVLIKLGLTPERAGG